MICYSSKTNPTKAIAAFRATLAADPGPWLLIKAARALEVAIGPELAYPYWLELLNHSSPQVVAQAVLSVTHPRYCQPLLEILAHRPELSIRIKAIRSLGRIQDSATLPSLAACLDDPELRPHTVQALGDLGDPRARPYLEAWRDDLTDAWTEDNHGPMLRVRELVLGALARLA